MGSELSEEFLVQISVNQQGSVCGAMDGCDSVRIAVGRPGVHSLSRVIPKDFKKWYSQLPCLALSIKKG